ncbi:unnamed protein product [Prorocentrum cordatum]|uniref:Uncharacterized protein n=1 Tax=Prorocentrum cordatum TaxID=2364126 RepID=A0ABN9RI46_9DINO|nr:unnamed protein product [Polarella glacialis]
MLGLMREQMAPLDVGAPPQQAILSYWSEVSRPMVCLQPSKTEACDDGPRVDSPLNPWLASLLQARRARMAPCRRLLTLGYDLWAFVVRCTTRALDLERLDLPSVGAPRKAGSPSEFAGWPAPCSAEPHSWSRLLAIAPSASGSVRGEERATSVPGSVQRVGPPLSGVAACEPRWSCGL